MVFFGFIQLIIFILPAYFANSIPVLLGGGTALDYGNKFIDGKPWFGKGKTIRGFIAGVTIATLIGCLQALVLSGTTFSYLPSWSDYVFCAFLLGVGTMFGDLIGSFIKRRLGFEQGSSLFFFDELTFLLFAISLTWAFVPLVRFLITPLNLGILLILTYVIHKIANIVANKLGWKKVPW